MHSSILIVAISLVGSTVGAVVWGDCGVETEGSSRTGFVWAMRNDDACTVVVAKEWATGGISNLNPLRDHYFNKDIFVQ
jgi:hypothetical protein